MSSLLIKGADVVVTMDDDRREIRNGSVLCKDGVIAYVGPTAELDRDEKTDQVLDARGCVVTPGLINTHHHLTSL